MNNIAPGTDGQANHTLSVLRSGSFEGSLTSHVEFLPGLFLHADPKLDLSGTYRSPLGRLLEFNAHTGPNPGNWVGLHLSLPGEDLRDKGVVGFAARISGPELMLLRVCLRSGTSSGFVDCFFDKHILLRPEEASHVDALSLACQSQLPLQAEWRELILFLPPKNFQFSLIDLRLFVV